MKKVRKVRFIVIESVLEDGFTVARDFVKLRRNETYSEAKINYVAERMKKFHTNNDVWNIEFHGEELILTRKDDDSILIIKEK